MTILTVEKPTPELWLLPRFPWSPRLGEVVELAFVTLSTDLR
jgi:hypothetical protein